MAVCLKGLKTDTTEGYYWCAFVTAHFVVVCMSEINV